MTTQRDICSCLVKDYFRTVVKLEHGLKKCTRMSMNGTNYGNAFGQPQNSPKLPKAGD